MNATSSHHQRRGFWLHQLTEYLVAFALVSSAAQSKDTTVLSVAALVVLVNAATTEGLLGAYRLTSVAVHRIIDICVAGLMCVAAVTLDVTSSTTVTLVGAAVVVALLGSGLISRWFRRNTAS
jgi:uncharacterized membrane protein YhaH (DUF805 family)